MDIGEQQRVIIVEPLELPDEIPADEPSQLPDVVPEPERAPA
jgi:hypothetical protein